MSKRLNAERRRRRASKQLRAAGVPDLLCFSAPVTIQASGEGKRPRIEILAYGGGLMRPQGWPELVVDLNGVDLGGEVPILTDHAEERDLDNIAGQGRAAIRNHQLHLSGHLTVATKAGQKVKALADDGISLQASVGLAPSQRDFLHAGQEVTVNNRRLTAGPAGLPVVRAARLREVTLLAVGADHETQVTISAKGTNTMSTDGNQTDQVNADLRAQLPENQTGLTDTEKILARWNRQKWHNAEGPKQRAEALMTAGMSGKITYQDFERGLLEEALRDSELCRIRAERPKAPGIHGSTRDANAQVIEAAFAKSVGLRSREKAYKPEVLEAADRLGSPGLQEVLLNAAGANGYAGGRHRIDAGNIREVLQAAFIRASGVPSTHTMSGILSNVANKVILDGFQSVEQTWSRISRTRPAADFKTMTIYRMTDDVEYEEVGPAGEIPHGTLGEESYTMKALTYAKMLGITRQDIINDDLGVFDTLQMRLGRGAGLALNTIFWTAFLDDAAFFTGARSNLITGAGGALTDDPDSLNAAVAAFAALTDAQGHPLGIQPSIVLAPPALAAIAKRLYASTEYRDTTASTRYVVANIYEGSFRPEVSAYLSSSAISGYSATGWYVLADPAIMPTIEVCFLDGQQSPTIESTDADFNTLGIQFRGYHDFGISLAEWRGGVKSEGA